MMKKISAHEKMQEFEWYLRDEEKSAATIEKYMRDVKFFISFAQGRDINKQVILDYKSKLCEIYALTSANSMIAALNRFLKFCGCGGMSSVSTGNLKSGHISSCGCLKSPDLTGKIFGKLTVIRRSEQRIKRGAKMRVAWECLCQCGNTVLRTSESLLDTKERMCAECSRKNSVACAFEGAGFEDGTQISKLKEMKPLSTNTSGCRGVYWHKKSQKWHVRLKFKNKLMWFGAYASYDDAVKARQRAEEEIYGAFLEERATRSLKKSEESV